MDDVADVVGQQHERYKNAKGEGNPEGIHAESLALDIIFNEPTCFGFSDGSVTVNVT